MSAAELAFRVTGTAALVGLLGLWACATPHHEKLRGSSDASANWRDAVPGDSIVSRDAPGIESSRPDTSDRVLIDVSGDSLVVELIDSQGRHSTWESWSGLRPDSQIPGCSRRAPELWNEYTGERSDHVSGELVSPAGGEYRLAIRKFRAGFVTLTVTRADGVRVADARVIRSFELGSGGARAWRLRWSEHRSEFAHVELTELPAPR